METVAVNLIKTSHEIYSFLSVTAGNATVIIILLQIHQQLTKSRNLRRKLSYMAGEAEWGAWGLVGHIAALVTVETATDRTFYS